MVKNPTGGWSHTLKNGDTQHFDAQGRLTFRGDRSGNGLTFRYDAQGNLQTVSDGQRSIAFSYDGSNKLTQVADPAGNIYSFNVSNSLDSVTFPDGAIISYYYEGNAFLSAKTDPIGNLTTYSYDDQYRLVSSIAPEGQTRTISYPEGDGTMRTTSFTEKDGSVWLYSYDTRTGDLLAKTDPQGNVTSYSYDADHNMLSKTEPEGDTTSYSYDARGNLISVTDSAGLKTGYSYNDYGQITSISGADGRVTAFEYDARGNMIKINAPDGTTSSFSYDEAGRIVESSSAGGRTSFSYDAFGNLESITGPDGSTASYTYDAAGNRTSMIDARANTTRFEYDARGRMVKLIDALGATTSFQYDAVGNRTLMIDANGNTTRYEYNAHGQMIKMIDALGNETAFEYSGSAECSTCSGGVDQLTALTDANGNTTRFGYDVLGRLIKEIDPLDHETLYGYDPAGRVTSKSGPSGNTIRYAYDVQGRLIAKTYPDGTGSSYSYDVGGRLKTAANEHISYSFSYDAADRLTNVTDSRGYSISYDYTEAGRRKSLSGPFGINNSYRYDEAGRLEGIDSQAGKFDFAYDVLGRRSALRFPNGVETSYTYNNLGRLTELVTASGPQIVAQSLYTHDAVGNRLSNQDARTTKSYYYDATYRLTEAVAATPGFSAQKDNGKNGKGMVQVVGNQKEFYQYDPVGNRITTSEHNSYNYNRGNELLGADRTSYNYDANGNRVKKITADGTTIYTWNAENQLVAIDLANGVRVTFVYDPFGRRIEKSVTNIEGYKKTRFVYDGEDILVETDADGSVGNRYVHGPGIDEPLALIGKKGTAYYHADGLGSIVAMTDDQARNVQQYEYDSFGNQHDMKNRIKQPYGYTGREHDRESGLTYYRARYYDGEVGRFISEDPIAIGGNIYTAGVQVTFSQYVSAVARPYAYTENNPINFIDPKGLYTEVIVWQPVGNGRSSFGHVSVDINDTTYSYGPNGMSIMPTSEYIERNTRFRDGVGLGLNLTPEQESRVQSCMKSAQGDYSSTANNCGRPIQRCLNQFGHDFLNVLPVSLGNDLIDSGIVNHYNFYYGPDTGPRSTVPWAK